MLMCHSRKLLSLAVRAGMGSHPSLDRQSPFLRPCCTLVRPAGLFVPKPLPSQPRSVHSRAAQAALFLRRGSRRANRLFLALLPGQVGHPPILNPASAAMLTMSASVEPSETI